MKNRKKRPAGECKKRRDDRGIGVIEVLLVLVVIIGLVLVFKNQIGAIITSAFNAINGNVETIIN
ncbi:MAG: hypothetical protein J6U10_04860 [Lachnospiraceae bacterium]|nr:hypothetical protein [Lachnospiraceae bacterium]MBP5184787.1 hypothetical protein [Lachnospiraceae bacterium]